MADNRKLISCLRMPSLTSWQSHYGEPCSWAADSSHGYHNTHFVSFALPTADLDSFFCSIRLSSLGTERVSLVADQAKQSKYSKSRPTRRAFCPVIHHTICILHHLLETISPKHSTCRSEALSSRYELQPWQSLRIKKEASSTAAGQQDQPCPTWHFGTDPKPRCPPNQEKIRRIIVKQEDYQHIIAYIYSS